MHANKALMTDALKGQMGFDGFIMGDWNAHGQIPGCINADCAKAFNAGLDIFNAPQDWMALYANLVREVNDGTIPKARLDDALRRILRVKMRMKAPTIAHLEPSSILDLSVSEIHLTETRTGAACPKD